MKIKINKGQLLYQKWKEIAHDVIQISVFWEKFRCDQMITEFKSEKNIKW